MSGMEIAQVLAAVLVVAGSAFSFLAGLGMLRLPDLYTRMHAASKAGVVGAGLVLLAVALLAGDFSVSLRAILGIAFLLLTTPVSAHLLARAGLRAGVKPASVTSINELNIGEHR